MPYIGKNPVGGGFHKLDSLTASATDTYALTLGSAAYYPESANQLLVSLNGVIQAPQDSFTVSGSNLVFDTALTVSDSIDFVVALGDVLAVQTVTDGAITTNKLGNGAVTSAKLAGLTSSDMPTGSVLQVVQGIKTDSANTTSTSFTNTGLFASITPSSASSKILIMVNTVISQSNFQKRVHLKLTGGNTASYIGDAGTGVESAVSVVTRVTDAYGMMPISMQYLDSPATTSAITYQVQWRVESDTAYMNRPATLDANGANMASTIILQEIAG